jgi:ClpP class serine protease
VAFPAVFEEVRKDMARVKERLHDANVGDDTQGIEQDIIDALTHMRDALKKAQQELGKSPPPPPPGMPPSGDPHMQKLLDEIAELKMIRELQKQVNSRTKRYGDRTPKAEQADDAQIKKELRDLSERQEKIETMVNNIVTKKNQ